MRTLSIFVNDQVVYTYDREIALDEKQVEFLNKMDSDMDRGIKIYGELISNPDNKQRATFVTLNLIRALQQENDAAVSVSRAYLVSRLPALVEVHAKDEESRVGIEFIEEH